MPNDDNKDIHWKQRCVHFQKAFLLLEQTMAIEHPSGAEGAGLIKFFEVSFELTRKVLKASLEDDGFTMVNPRDTIKQAFQAGLMENSHPSVERGSLLEIFPE